MRIMINFESYNRYKIGNPWISKIIGWEDGKNPKVKFGKYIGDHNGGEAEIVAEPGDVIRWGHAHGGSKGKTKNGVVQLDGSIIEIREGELKKKFLEKMSSNNVVLIETCFGSRKQIFSKYSDSDLIEELTCRGYQVSRRKEAKCI